MPLSKKELQNIVQTIKKEATPFGEAGGGTAPTGGGGGATQRPAGGNYFNPNAPAGGTHAPRNVVGPIKDMQAAMQNFAATAVSYGAQKKQPGQPQPQDVDANKRHFNDFLAEQFLNNADMKGEEFTPDEKRISKESKQPTELIEMNIILNGLKRIGGAQSELTADNMWDFRTNNALKNIYAFAYGLVNIAKEFQRTNVQAFTQEDLDKMKGLIPEERDPADMPMNEKVQSAKELTPLIKKLTGFYRYYIQNVAMHPAFKRYIVDDEPMLKLQSGEGDPSSLTPDETSLMKNVADLSIGNNAIPYAANKFPIEIPSTQGTGGAIGVGGVPLSALQNVDTFRSYLAGYGTPKNRIDAKVMRFALNNIMKHIDSVLDLPAAQQKAPAQQTPAPAQNTQVPNAGPGVGVRDVKNRGGLV